MAVRFKWNLKGFAEVRSRPAVTGMLRDAAKARAARAGDGYEVRGPEVSRGRGRGRAAVITGNAEARKAEATRHNLARG